MAAEQELLVRIAADISDLVKKLQAAGIEVEGFGRRSGRASVATAGGLREVRSATRDVYQAISGLSTLIALFGDESTEAERKVKQLAAAIATLAALRELAGALPVLEGVGRAISRAAAEAGVAALAARNAGGRIADLGLAAGAALHSVAGLSAGLAGIAAIGIITVGIVVTVRGLQEAKRQLEGIAGDVIVSGGTREQAVAAAARAAGPGTIRFFAAQAAVERVSESIGKLAAHEENEARAALAAVRAKEEQERAYNQLRQAVDGQLRSEIEALRLRAQANRLSETQQIEALSNLRSGYAAHTKEYQQLTGLINTLEDQRAAKAQAASQRSASEARQAARERLQVELQTVENLAATGQLTADEQIAHLRRVRATHATTAQEKLAIEARIIDIERRQHEARMAQLLAQARAAEAAARERLGHRISGVSFGLQMGGSTQDAITAIDAILALSQSSNEQIRSEFALTEAERIGLLRQRAQLVKQLADEEQRQFEEDMRRRNELATEEFNREIAYREALFEYELLIGKKTLEDKRARIQAELAATAQGTVEEIQKKRELAETNAAIADRDLAALRERTDLTKDQVREQLEAWLAMYEAMGEAGALAAQRIRAALSGVAVDTIDLTDLLDERFKEWGNLVGNVLGGITSAFSTFFSEVLTGAKSFSDAFASLWQSIVDHILQLLAQLAANVVFWGILTLLGVPVGSLFNFLTTIGMLSGLVKKSHDTGGIVRGPALVPVGPITEAFVPLTGPHAGRALSEVGGLSPGLAASPGSERVVRALREQTDLLRDLVRQGRHQQRVGLGDALVAWDRSTSTRLGLRLAFAAGRA